MTDATATANSGQDQTGIYRLTDLQWYLARNRNRVHYMAVLRAGLSLRQVNALVSGLLEQTPELLRSEWVEDECHRDEPFPDLSGIVRYETCERLDVDPQQWAQARFHDVSDRPLPACRAFCLSARRPDARGNRTILVLQTTHALAEGSDLGFLLRGRNVTRAEKLPAAPSAGWGSAVARKLLAPLLALVHVLSSQGERRDPAGYRFVSVDASNRDLSLAAKRLGVSRQAFQFACVLSAMVPEMAQGKRKLFSYSALPKRRIELGSDAYLRMQMQVVSMSGKADIADFSRAIQVELDRQARSGTFSQLLYNDVLVVQRFLARWIPGLYKRVFKGYSPYPIVLSLVPPVLPGAPYEVLRDARAYAGSSTGTTANCIFLPGREMTSFNFWLDPQMHERIPDLLAILRMHGVDAELLGPAQTAGNAELADA